MFKHLCIQILSSCDGKWNPDACAILSMVLQDFLPVSFLNTLKQRTKRAWGESWWSSRKWRRVVWYYLWSLLFLFPFREVTTFLSCHLWQCDSLQSGASGPLGQIYLRGRLGVGVHSCCSWEWAAVSGSCLFGIKLCVKLCRDRISIKQFISKISLKCIWHIHHCVASMGLRKPSCWK